MSSSPESSPVDCQATPPSCSLCTEEPSSNITTDLVRWGLSGGLVCVCLVFVLHLISFLIFNVASLQGSRKLSYAEVCQRLAKDPPLAQTPSSSSSTSSASSPVQPLQELKVNKVEELQPNSKCKTDRPQKARDGRPFRQPLLSFRGANAQAKFRGTGLKIQEQQRRKYPSQPGSRRSGKEQNIPPSSPKWPHGHRSVGKSNFISSVNMICNI